jgi:hypothetical protein
MFLMRRFVIPKVRLEGFFPGGRPRSRGAIARRGVAASRFGLKNKQEIIKGLVFRINVFVFIDVFNETFHFINAVAGIEIRDETVEGTQPDGPFVAKFRGSENFSLEPDFKKFADLVFFRVMQPERRERFVSQIIIPVVEKIKCLHHFTCYPFFVVPPVDSSE